MSIRLNQISPPAGAVHRVKRVGRGESSGRGKTSGRGNKGQKARAGGFHKTGFEGGQMPLMRRLPKRGFRSLDQTEYVVVNVSRLSVFEAHSEVDAARLAGEGLIKTNHRTKGVKILGDGDLSRPLTVKATCFSASAREKIERAGGKAIVTLKERESPNA